MSKSLTATYTPGPFSRDRALTAVDKRTKAGRLYRTTVAALAEQIGGNPSPAQALLIQSAALKAMRLFLLSEKLLEGGEVGQGSEHHALGWLNSMRADLQALGLESRQLEREKEGPSLADIIARNRADGAGSVAK
ncbi:MAG: hypothetical protein KF904_16610 [Rhodoblastus sp.]|nr:hypothetical protein [Rhodoblastus sp.]